MSNSLQNGRCSFISTTPLVYTSTLTISTKNPFSTSVTFQIPFPPLLVQKIIFTISTNTPFLYTSAIFHLPKLLRTIYPKNIFPASAIQPIQTASRDHGARVLISPSFLKVQTVITGLTFTDSLSLRFRNLEQSDYLQSQWQIIQSNFSHTLNLLLLLPYPTNTIARSHIPLETSCLT